MLLGHSYHMDIHLFERRADAAADAPPTDAQTYISMSPRIRIETLLPGEQRVPCEFPGNNYVVLQCEAFESAHPGLQPVHVVGIAWRTDAPTLRRHV